jgi:HK97 family phage prohead protease
MKDNILNKKQFADVSISLKGIDEKNRTIKGIVASDGLEDRHGEKLSPEGWIINDHVPFLWGHDYSSLPVGKSTSEVVKNGQLIIDGFLSKKYDFAGDLFDLITEGIVDKVSVGFIPKEYDESGDYTFSKQELIELSFVNVPANPRAGIKAKIKSVEEGLAKLLEMSKKDEEVETEPEPEAPQEEEKDENEVSNETETKMITLTKEELKEMVIEVVKELQPEPEPQPEEDNEETKEVEEPETKTVLEQLTEVRDALRGQYAGTAKTLEQINKYLKKGK